MDVAGGAPGAKHMVIGLRLLLAAAVTLVAFFLKMEFAAFQGAPYIFFFPAIMVSAVVGGVLPGLLATALSAALALRWVLPAAAPGGEITQSDMVAFCTFAAIGIFMSVVGGLYRRTRSEKVRLELERDVRDREERSRRESEEAQRRYALLADAARDIILFIRVSDGRILEANAAALAAYGYSAEELRALTIRDLRAPDHVDAVAGHLAAAERGGLQFETRHRRKDGTTFPVEVSSQGADLAGARVVLSVVRDVSARRRAEDQLRSSEARLRLFFEHAPASVAMFDREMCYVATSRRYLQDYGLPDQALAGRCHYDVFPEVPARWREINRRVLTGAVESCEEDPFPRADGSTDWVRWEMRPWRDAGGEIGGAVLFSEVITKRKLAEERLAQSERRYRFLADHAHDVIWTLDLASGRFTYVSPSIQVLRGLTVEEALAEPMARSLTPESLVRAQAVMARIGTPEEQDPHTAIYDQPCKDGRVKHVEITTTIVRDANGHPFEVVGVSRDATARVDAQRALAENEELYRSLFQLTPSGVVLLDEDGAVVAFNDQACRQLGYTRAEFATLHVGDIDVAGREAVAAQLARNPTEGPGELEVVHRTRAGELRNVVVNTRPVQVGGHRRLLSSWQDVTERRMLEEQFRQAQKLETVGRLAGGVAHDFNNLLTVILSCSSTLEEVLSEQLPAGLEDVREIDAAAKRAAELTGQLLAFARKRIISPVPLDLGEVVLGSERMLRRLLGEDVDLRVERQADLWTTSADPGQLSQVIVNLAVNARDAMPTGGTLLIQALNATTTAELAAIDPERRVGDWVRVVITDTGTGMSEEVRAHLFEPFFTTKGPGKGTGLGLATVYGIVRQAGGHVHVTNAPGGGTSFELCFPRVDAAPVSLARPAELAGAGGDERVLVVEDDAQVRAVTVRLLRAAGYQVVAVAHPAEALAMSWDGADGPMLLVTDVVMPGIDGLTLARELRGRHPALRTLYLSGYTPDAIAERGALDPGVELLPKPFTGPVLLARVRAILDAPPR
jgi:two-component system cell cycle sensor histidine kinase/response regulator CckA